MCHFGRVPNRRDEDHERLSFIGAFCDSYCRAHLAWASHSEPELLAGCYRSCFAVAYQHDLKSLAFPSISTGAGAYPVEKASVIALRKIQLAIKQYPEFEKIIVACFDQKRWRFTRKPKAGRHRNYDSSLASSVNLRESTSLFVVPPVQLLPFL
jgi:hypothetical protein